MYDDPDSSRRRDSRPLSFVSSPLAENMDHGRNYPDSPRSATAPTTPITERVPQVINGTSTASGRRVSKTIENGSLSPPGRSAPISETATQQFPLQDIDYESSPAAVAQELSNLQAIRRMSMDVNAADPDLPTFSTSFGVPTVAPSHNSDEDDTSRLFWVPARVHPELAPKEFKSFIQDRVEKIRRRSGGEDSLSPDSPEQQGTSGGLRRKKSMLSRQIDTPAGYRDGADRLEKKRSISEKKGRAGQTPNLQELETLVNDPSTLVRTLSIDTARRSLEPGSQVLSEEDLPILPPAPAGQTLKRSTRTQYRRGSLRKGERAPFAKRAGGRQVSTDTEESPLSSPSKVANDEPHFKLARVQTEPVLPVPRMMGELSPPPRKESARAVPGTAISTDEATRRVGEPARPEHEARSSSLPKPFHSRIASNGRTTAPLPGYNPPVPQIIETPPPPSSNEPHGPQPTFNQNLPERKSSHEPPLSTPFSGAPRTSSKPNPGRQSSRPPLLRQTPSITLSGQTIDDIASKPSPLPGSSTRTDSLSFIPTLAEEKKVDKKAKDKRDSGDSVPRKTSWGWLLGGDEKDKDKERKDKEEKETAKRSKSKAGKSGDKAYDSTRLDVLQTSIDGGKGRESLVLDRDTVKLDDERKRESMRKASGESKKDKDTGLFSSLFGGSKRKGDKDSTSRKANSLRGLSPEPPPRILKPDIDYNWTRFSILEERAIYRMAHIKLANPRRALYSQVLLSNFMYSYLAKVQQMHPYMQIPQSPAQRKQQQQQQLLEQQSRTEQQEQPDELELFQRFHEVSAPFHCQLMQQ